MFDGREEGAAALLPVFPADGGVFLAAGPGWEPE